MGQVVNRDFVKYHLHVVLRGAIAETNGDEALSRCLHAETKLRLMNMSDEELREIAKQTLSPPERPVELVYKGIKQEIEKVKATATKWMNDLVKEGNDSPYGEQ